MRDIQIPSRLDQCMRARFETYVTTGSYTIYGISKDINSIYMEYIK